jgi:uncharacterized SAM-binding protein YcdF (DUF218 family)
MILDTLKESLQPGSITAMMLVFAFGLILLYAKPRWGRIWLTIAVLAYWALASPAGANQLARSLSTGYGPLQRAEDARGANTVVLLGGGSINLRAAGRRLSYVSYPTGLRALEAARVYHLLGDPLVIASGGVTGPDSGVPPESEAQRSALVTLGVPSARIVSESESRNTHDEGVVLRRMLRERNIDRFVLVTSPLHMRRSLATFAAQGLNPIPSPAPLYSDRISEPYLLVPDQAAFEVGNGAVYEWIARGYYWSRGWTSPVASAP